MAAFFEQVTTLLQQHPPPGTVPATTPVLAPFAAAVYAVDHTILDPVLRKRKLLRELPPGDRCLLPGALGCVFDVRQQQWVTVRYVPDPQQDLHGEIPPLVTGRAPGSLLRFDLGYFAFWWFDHLTDAGYWYVTRLREKVTWEVQHVYYDGGTAQVQLWDGLVYLGKHRADRAGHPVRLIRLTVQQGRQEQTYTYLTNVLDPRLLPAWQVAELYRRRWDIEQGFHLVKTHLGLQLLWSSFPNVYATFIIAQIVLALRNEIAARAGVEPREVSLALLLRWLPQLARDGHDPVAEFVAKGRTAGYLRPFRGRAWSLPEIMAADYQFPDQPIPWRKPRYGSRDYQQRTAPALTEKDRKRQRYWGTPGDTT
jgi:hypothetical protein